MVDTTQPLPGPPRKNDHFLLRAIDSNNPLVDVYLQEGTEIVLGASCKPELDLHLDACRKDRVPVSKRRGGGGAVVLSPGMIIVLVAGPIADRFKFHHLFGLIDEALIASLKEAGVAGAVREGVCDLAVDGRKVHGGSLYLARSRFFYQGSLLYDPDLNLMDRYLKYPQVSPDYRRGREHAEFCAMLTRTGIKEPIESLSRTIGQRLNEVDWSAITGR